MIERDDKSCIYGKAIGTNIPGNFTIDIYECWQRRVSKTSNVEMAMKIAKNYKGSHKKVKVNSVEKYINFMEKQLLA